MSTPAVRRPAARGAAPAVRPARRPHLQVVPAPSPVRSVVPFLVLCATILAGALLAVLLLNTQMAATAYQLREEQLTLNRLNETEASLRAQVERAGSPAVLEERAEELGMVPAEDVRFVHLERGEILGGDG